MHTKVLGTFHNALSTCPNGDSNLFISEQMAEAVTFYLYSKQKSKSVTTDEIYLMILAVLKDTGHAAAAEALNHHRSQRRLQRKRIEVISDHQSDDSHGLPWNKSTIVFNLVSRQNINRSLARAIAGSVEDKVLKMGLSKVRTSLVGELVQADTECMLRAEQQLKIAAV